MEDKSLKGQSQRRQINKGPFCLLSLSLSLTSDTVATHFLLGLQNGLQLCLQGTGSFAHDTFIFILEFGIKETMTNIKAFGF